MTTDKPKAHLGRNVKSVRDLFRVSQEGLAERLRVEWNQKRVSLLEAREEIDDEILERVAKALQVPAEAIKQYDPEKVMCYIQNNHEGSNTNATNVAVCQNNYNCTFAADQSKKTEELYAILIKEQEQRIKEKDEMIAVMQKLIEKLEGKK